MAKGDIMLRRYMPGVGVSSFGNFRNSISFVIFYIDW